MREALILKAKAEEQVSGTGSIVIYNCRLACTIDGLHLQL
jgi:hypothetical protein